MTELEFLRDRVEQLEEALGINIDLPNELGLTPLETRIVGALVKREIVNRDVLFAVLYSDRLEHHQPDPKTIDVHMCKLRKKLKAKKVRIYSRYGVGYYIDETAKATLKNLQPVYQGHFQRRGYTATA